MGVWSADQDALLTYTIQEDFMSSTWDWIGLYKVQTGQTQREKTNNTKNETDLICFLGFFAGGIQKRIRLWNLCVGQRERPARDKWSHTGKVQVWDLCHVWTNTICTEMHASLIWMCMLWLQISVDKDEIPLLSGQYLLGYFSTNMQSILGLSANFQVSVPLLHL